MGCMVQQSDGVGPRVIRVQTKREALNHLHGHYQPVPELPFVNLQTQIRAVLCCAVESSCRPTLN
jgi:hypothetical protein